MCVQRFAELFISHHLSHSAAFFIEAGKYNRFAKFLPDVRVGVFYGGTPVQTDIELLGNKDTHPHIIVGTPGRINALVRDRHLRLANLEHFVLDECDKMLDQPGETEVIFAVAHACLVSGRADTALFSSQTIGGAHIRSLRCTRHDFRRHRSLRTFDLFMFSVSLVVFAWTMPLILLEDVIQYQLRHRLARLAQCGKRVRDVHAAQCVSSAVGTSYPLDAGHISTRRVSDGSIWRCQERWYSSSCPEACQIPR